MHMQTLLSFYDLTFEPTHVHEPLSINDDIRSLLIQVVVVDPGESREVPLVGEAPADHVNNHLLVLGLHAVAH